MRKSVLLISVMFLMAINMYSQKEKIVHVFVALCDNENQGIIPVKESLGNGMDPDNNLYWGALYGVKTYFKNSDEWDLIRTDEYPLTEIIERAVFRSSDSSAYLIADAYEGAQIKKAVVNFLHASSGKFRDSLEIENKKLLFGGDSDLIAYVGHNGLMDFSVQDTFYADTSRKRDVMIISCKGKNYFSPYMKALNVNPLVWSTALMAAEAYTLKWAIDGWLKEETDLQIVNRARKAYHHYQKCGMNGATRLLTTGY